ncbi:hypothetical protein Tco_1249920 [Tanacetum coccineum]
MLLNTTTAPALSSPSTPSPQLYYSVPDDALMATMTQMRNLLSGFQKQFPPQPTTSFGLPPTQESLLRWSVKARRCYVTTAGGEGHVARQYAEAEAFLADVECTQLLINIRHDYNQHGVFFSNHVALHMTQTWMKAPMLAVLFMANLSSNSAKQPMQSMRFRNISIFLDTEAKMFQLSEEVLVHQVVSMKKMNEKPGHVRPANDFYAKLNALMFVPQKELSGDQAYWLSANEIASQASKPATPATPFVHKSRPPSQVLASLQKVNAVFPQFEGGVEKKNLLIRNDGLIAECLEKDICSIVLTSDIVVSPSLNFLCEDLRSACDREHTKVLELEAEISKQKQLC